jgi:protein-L-isoaspartate O-methyltransferase
MKNIKRLARIGISFAFLSVVSAYAADSLIDDLRYLPSGVSLVVGFEPWPVTGDAASFRDQLLGAVGFDRDPRKLSDALTGARRVVLSAVHNGDGAIAWLGVVHIDRQISPDAAREAGVAIDSLRPGFTLFGDPAQIKRALERETSDEDSVASGMLLEPIVKAADIATVWGVLTRKGVSCQGCARRCAAVRAAADSGSFAHSLAGMQWWSFALSGDDASRFVMRTRARSAEDAAILADEQRGVLAALRFGARSRSDGIYSLLRQARVMRDGVMIDLELPSDKSLLRWLCRKNDCYAPLKSMLRWQTGAEQREATERTVEVLRRLGVSPGEHVADVGAGLGFFTVRLARVVGNAGLVVAVEIDGDIVSELRMRANEAPYPQVEVVLGGPDDPKLAPQSFDAVLIVNAYHEMPQHQQMLKAIRRALKPDGRLMLLEPFAPEKRVEPRGAQEREHVLAPELAEQDLREAGFVVVERDETFVLSPCSSNVEWLLLARPSAPPAFSPDGLFSLLLDREWMTLGVVGEAWGE